METRRSIKGWAKYAQDFLGTIMMLCWLTVVVFLIKAREAQLEKCSGYAVRIQ
jgi:hypothetical protein